MTTRRTVLSVITFLIALNLKANVLPVPAIYASIQSAINASVSGDTIEVSPGTYFENINFTGKNVLLTSLYYLDSDTTYILSTIINGSSPINPDTASCVIFNSGEDSTAILQGFTITGGTGTKWTDIHGAGLFREGGGILIEESSPSILNNIISNNIVTNTSGVISTGGGGIRIGDGNPTICGNLIANNQGRYGPGIVLNYTGCKITNNIITSNTGGEEFNGGSGIWMFNNLGNTPKIITNNTIINNSATQSSGTGGISIIQASNVIIKNNIIWGNTPSTQIKTQAAIPEVSYSDVQGGFAGEGNINLDPEFDLINYYLSDNSPCIDAGDTSAVYSDLENSSLPGNALFPSKGLLRNDMGAYGGPCTSLLPFFFQSPTSSIQEATINNAVAVSPNPFSDQTTIQSNELLERVNLVLYNSSGEKVKEIENFSGHTYQLDRDNLPDGLYFLLITKSNKIISTAKITVFEN